MGEETYYNLIIDIIEEETKKYSATEFFDSDFAAIIIDRITKLINEEKLYEGPNYIFRKYSNKELDTFLKLIKVSNIMKSKYRKKIKFGFMNDLMNCFGNEIPFTERFDTIKKIGEELKKGAFIRLLPSLAEYKAYGYYIEQVLSKKVIERWKKEKILSKNSVIKIYRLIERIEYNQYIGNIDFLI